ncbi:MAG TPA: response regulator transcription factor [Ilumatobacteraceae bacterium]
MIRVVIVDDQALIRGGLAALIDSAADLEVVGQAENGRDAVRVIADLAPDVVLMDIRMPVMDGIAATEALALDGADGPKVIMLTTFDLDEYVYAALRAGASGFLLKDTPPNDLLNGIRVVAAGDSLLAPSVTRHLIEQYVQRPSTERPAGRDFERLTERELEVLRLVARGLSNQEIGDDLFVSPATAKTHVSRLLMKLAARDRAQLIVIAYETGLVEARPR